MENEVIAIIESNPDPLKATEDKLRGDGAWGDVYGKLAKGHYFIARNPKINTAISLCREVIIPFDKLTLTDPQNKCMVCSLMSETRLKEAKLREDIRLKRGDAIVYRSKCYQLTMF